MDGLDIEDSQRYTMRSPNVVADAVDNEVVAVNLESGTYFSLFQQSAWLWTALTSGQPVGIVVEAIKDHSPYSRDDVLAFLAELIRHDLVEPLALEHSLDSVMEQLSELPPAPFAPLVINVHRDLEDILLLDPVHDSGETGWPEAR